MKTKTLSIIAITFMLILGACTPAKPAPTIEAGGYQAVTVDHVEVETGVGSPIPVHVNVSGSLPDTCAQIEYVQLLQDETSFHITLSTIASDEEECISDNLPFRIKLPLNVTGLPAGNYTVDVNGSGADFKLDSGSPAPSLPTVDSAFYKDDVQVNSVDVEIGQGSPIPVHAIVGLSLPNTCGQLGEIRLHRDGTTFFVRLVSYVIEGDDCRADSIPFRLEVPLNIVNLPEGPYEVNVNGVTASFDPRAVPAESGEALIPAGWAPYTSASQQCGYSISYPPELQVSEQTPYSQTLGVNLAESDAGARNFIYVSVITPEIQNMVKQGLYNHDIYNYDPMATEILLSMQVGERKSVHQSPNVATGFTFERKPDMPIGSHSAQTFENLEPWEFPSGTKEIRYYLSLDGCAYLFGGYMDMTQSNQPGAITEDLFQQIIATIQIMP